MTAEELRALKASTALSAEELAKAAGYARTTVRRWLSGERAIGPAAERRLRAAVDHARRAMMEG